MFGKETINRIKSISRVSINSYKISTAFQGLFNSFMLPVYWFLFLCISSGWAIGQAKPGANLTVSILDNQTGTPTPVRVHISKDGHAIQTPPRETIAVMYGVWDHADGYAYQQDSSFYVNGRFQVNLPSGKYVITLTKGNEYIAQKHEILIDSSQPIKKTYQMKRWINMPRRNWYSADGHIHIRRSPREDSLLLKWIQAEDIHVGVMMRMGDFWEIYYPQYEWGEKGAYKEDGYFFVSGQEDPRTPELGHALGMGSSDRVRNREEYYYYDNIFDSLHTRGGITGYAHYGQEFKGYRGLILDGLRNKVDALEILQFCGSGQALRVDHYYHMLDLGFPMTAIAGSDFPWCGKNHVPGKPENSAQIGNARFYTYSREPLTYQSWKTGLKAGHTFVSTGPVLDFTVNNRLPGEKIDIRKGETLTITAHAYGHKSQVPLQTLEIVGHGKVLARVTSRDPGQSAEHLSIKLNIAVPQGMWIAARCYGSDTQAAHTTPVYVTVEGGGFHNPVTVPHYLALSEQYLKEIEMELDNKNNNPEYQAWRYKQGLQLRINETRRIIDKLKTTLN